MVSARSEATSNPSSGEGCFPGCRAVQSLGREPLELSDEVLDALLAGARTAEEIAGPDGLLGQLDAPVA